MNPVILKTTKHFLAGFLSSAWNGGIGALAGIMGNDGAAMAGVPDVQVLSFKAMFAVFFGAAILHGVFWLKAHPLPEEYDSASPFFPAAKIVPPKDPPSALPQLPTT